MSFSCSECQSARTQVYDSRPNSAGTIINRRRKCQCGHRFTTYELTSEAYAALANLRNAAGTIVKNHHQISGLIEGLSDIPQNLGPRPKDNSGSGAGK